MTETERAWRLGHAGERAARPGAAQTRIAINGPAAPDYRHLRSPANSVGSGQRRPGLRPLENGVDSELAADNVRLTRLILPPTPADSSANTPTQPHRSRLKR